MLLKFVTYLLCAIHLIHCKKSDDDSSFTWQSNSVLPIEHSFGIDDQFTSRGQIAFRSSKETTAYFTNEIELNENELEKLKNLAQQDGLYFIRSPIKIGGNLNTVDNETTRYVSTFVKACYLYGSRLTEKITIAIDFYGNVIGLSIISPRSDCLQEIHIPPHNAVFNSTVLIQSQVAGPVPDTQLFVKKIEQEKHDQATGKGKDNRSFIAKYWMYIVPVVLVVLLSSQAEPQEGGGE